MTTLNTKFPYLNNQYGPIKKEDIDITKKEAAKKEDDGRESPTADFQPRAFRACAPSWLQGGPQFI